MINYDTRSLAEGDNVVTEIEFDFLVSKKTDVQLSIVKAGEDTIVFRGDNATYLTDLTFDSVNGGGLVTLVTALATGQTLYIDLDVQEPDQTNTFRIVTNYLTSFRTVERALDYTVTQIQTLSRWKEQSVKLPRHVAIADFNPDLPEDIVGDANKILITNITGTGLDTSSMTLSSLIADYATAVAAGLAAAASAVAAAVSAAAALASQVAAAASAVASAVSAAASAASAAAAAATAAGLTGTNVIDKFTGDDVTTVFNLSVDPGTESNCDVYISGVHQDDSNYTVVGQVLTFVTAPPTEAADNIIVKMSALLAGVPSDDSVSEVKIQDGAVTAVKRPLNVRSATSAVDVGVSTDEVILADPTAGSFNLAMPPSGPTGSGREVTVVNVATNGNYVRLIGDGADLLNGNATHPTDLLSYDSTKWICDGSNWIRVG